MIHLTRFAVAPLILACVIPFATAIAQTAGNNRAAPIEVSYRADQARRGKDVFDRSCKRCHSVESDAAPKQSGDPIPLVGQPFVAKWSTVGDLFSKTRSTMPADAVGRLPIDSTLDVVA